jgi:hypothetical protein
MRTKTILSAIAVTAALATGGLFLSPSFARDGGNVAGKGQPWLSIAQVADRLDAAGYRNIEEIEREHGGYEVRATDRDGRRVKLRLDPWTGEVEQARSQRKRHGEDARGFAEAGRRGVECSERRCRDDLPQTGSVKPAQPN